MEEDGREGDGFENLGRDGSFSGGQSSLETTGMQPTSPLGEMDNNDNDDDNSLLSKNKRLTGGFIIKFVMYLVFLEQVNQYIHCSLMSC